MTEQPDLPVATPYEKVDDVVDSLRRIERIFLGQRDRRAVFATAYRLITEELNRWIEAGRFHDREWVERYLVHFADLYRKALHGYGNQRADSLSKAWRISFDASASGSVLVIGDLILGINAHINHDLAHALFRSGIDEQRQARYEDHTRVNDALQRTTEAVQDRIAELYASGLGDLDRVLGELDEEVTAFKFVKARDHAWSMGTALADASSESARQAVAEAIDTQATTLARLTLTPRHIAPGLLDALQRVEQQRGWWRCLEIDSPETEAGAEGFRSATRSATPTGDGFAAALEPVIERLDEWIERFDAERNRLSIYATAYRRNTVNVKNAMEAGEFRDPEWMSRLDVRFAEDYFRILQDYEVGRSGHIPRCWRKALDAVTGGRTMIVQDIAVQIIPRVVYDLPIVLAEVGLEQHRDDRLSDYEKTYQLFMNELDAIQRMIAQKYSGFVSVMDVLGTRLDERISNCLYTQAREEAWQDGLTLAGFSSDSERQKQIRELNGKAIDGINKFLFADIPPLAWASRAVRRIEDSFPGDWSDQVPAHD